MLDAKDIKAATLVRADGKKIRYEFDCKYLAIWSFPTNGDYVCVEPWDSLPDFVGSSTEMMEKESLIHLEPGKTYKFGYSMEFINCH